MPQPLRIVFLGCGYITKVHSRHLGALRSDIVCSYASRDAAKADAYCRRFQGVGTYSDYSAAIADPRIDAVVVAVPPRFHLDLTLQALSEGKHVLVEKPAFPTLQDYRTVRQARDAAGLVVLVGENDHYKPLAITLRKLLAGGVIGELVFAHFTTIARKFKPAGDWRNDPEMAGGDAFFEEGIHWLHLANSLGPTITNIQGYQPRAPQTGTTAPLVGDTRLKSMMVAFQYNNSAAGALYYSREIPSLLRGLRLSKLFGRDGIITFESNGSFVFARGKGLPRFILPGFSDIRGYKAMYKDFVGSIRNDRAPEMSLERAIEDQVLMERIYST
jgi:predicted dehydrogenase